MGIKTLDNIIRFSDIMQGNVHKGCPFFGGEGGSKMTPKNRTLEGKNRTLGGRGGQKSSKIVGHHL